MVPRRFGPATDRYTLPLGVVCDPCNTWLGRQVDAPFGDRFDLSLSSALEGLAGRAGLDRLIDGRDATSRLELSMAGGSAALLAAKADPTAEGGLDIEIRPRRRDPDDIVSRTVRALWKIGLGCLCLDRGPESALAPEWDGLRRAILGHPFRGYLLQKPFEARVTRELRVTIADDPTRPDAIIFALGGVILGAPLKQGSHARSELAEQDWVVRTTQETPPSTVHLRLEPS